MKIGIDARLWNETGVGRYIRNLVGELQELDKKNEYTLFIPQRLEIKDLGLKNSNWKVVKTDIRWHTLKEQVYFTKVLKKENLDLVHFPYFSVPIFYNKPFVITIHDLIINHFPTGKASTLPSPLYYGKLLGYKFIIKQAAQKAQKVITVSNATKREIIDHLHIPKEKIVVTYEGVDEKVENIKEKTTNYKLRTTNYFLYVGNAYPHKNLDRLVEAFTLVIKEYSDVKLVLVGKKNYFYDRLEKKIIEQHLENNILFVGNVNDDELLFLYSHAEALVFPSLMEGFGLPGLEAMQSGCLVLAADIPALKEIYQDAAVYFDPLAVESISDTIQKVLKNKKEFHSYIIKGKEKVKTFSWRKMAEETVQIYESCVSLRSDQ